MELSSAAQTKSTQILVRICDTRERLNSAFPQSRDGDLSARRSPPRPREVEKNQHPGMKCVQVGSGPGQLGWLGQLLSDRQSFPHILGEHLGLLKEGKP